MDMLEIAVSTMSTPTSIAHCRFIPANPVVAWVCKWMGTLTIFLISLIKGPITWGVNSPAMSLMQIISDPMSSNCLAICTYSSRLWTGLTV